MSITLAEVQPIVTGDKAFKDSDIAHLVCCCTDYNTAACGLDRTGKDWAEEDAPERVVCTGLWPTGAPCPFCGQMCCS